MTKHSNYDFTDDNFDDSDQLIVMQRWIEELEELIPQADSRRMFFDSVNSKVARNISVSNKEYMILKNMYLKAKRDEE